MEIQDQLSAFTYEAYLSGNRDVFVADLIKAIDKILVDTGANADHAIYFTVSDSILEALQNHGHKIFHVDYDGACNHYASWEPNAGQIYLIVGFGNDPTEIQ